MKAATPSKLILVEVEIDDCTATIIGRRQGKYKIDFDSSVKDSLPAWEKCRCNYTRKISNEAIELLCSTDDPTERATKIVELAIKNEGKAKETEKEFVKEQKRRRVSLEDAVKRFANSNQKERWQAGVLQHEEVIQLVTDNEFKQLIENGYAILKPNDFHLGELNDWDDEGCCEGELEMLTAEQWEMVKRIKSLVQGFTFTYHFQIDERGYDLNSKAEPVTGHYIRLKKECNGIEIAGDICIDKDTK